MADERCSSRRAITFGLKAAVAGRARRGDGPTRHHPAHRTGAQLGGPTGTLAGYGDRALRWLTPSRRAGLVAAERGTRRTGSASWRRVGGRGARSQGGARCELLASTRSPRSRVTPGMSSMRTRNRRRCRLAAWRRPGLVATLCRMVQEQRGPRVESMAGVRELLRSIGGVLVHTCSRAGRGSSPGEMRPSRLSTVDADVARRELVDAHGRWSTIYVMRLRSG